MPDFIKVIHIDRHSMILKGVSDCLNKYENVKVVGTGINRKTAFELVETLKPDFLITNFYWDNDESALDHLPALKEKLPSLKVIFLTMYFQRELAFKVINNGIADSYLIMSLRCEEIYNCIMRLNEGIGTCYFPTGKN